MGDDGSASTAQSPDPPAANPEAAEQREADASQTKRVEPELTRADVRTALLHFAELAVAFEGFGVEIVEPDTPLSDNAQDDEALACLDAVVKRLMKHRQRQRDSQRQELATVLHAELEAIYDKIKKGDGAESAAAEIESLLARHGFKPFPVDVDDLVPEGDALKPGPAMAAANALAPFVGRNWRSLFTYRSDRNAHRFWRKAWRRWVPPRLARRYVSDVVTAAIAARDAATTPPISDMKDLAEPFLAMLERRAEAHFRDQFRAMFEAAFLGDLEGLRREGQAVTADQLLATREQIQALIRAGLGFEDDDSSANERVLAEYRQLVLDLVEAELEKLGLQESSRRVDAP